MSSPTLLASGVLLNPNPTRITRMFSFGMSSYISNETFSSRFYPEEKLSVERDNERHGGYSLFYIGTAGIVEVAMADTIEGMESQMRNLQCVRVHR